MGLDNLKKGVYVFVERQKTSNSKQVYSRLVNYYYERLPTTGGFF
jgi:hypothetical protein